MIGDGLHVHVAVLRQVRDRDQHGVFDAGEADDLGMAAADALVMRRKAEQGVHQMAELPVAPVGQQLRPRGRERHCRPLLARGLAGRGGPRASAARRGMRLLAGRFIQTG